MNEVCDETFVSSQTFDSPQRCASRLWPASRKAVPPPTPFLRIERPQNRAFPTLIRRGSGAIIAKSLKNHTRSLDVLLQ